MGLRDPEIQIRDRRYTIGPAGEQSGGTRERVRAGDRLRRREARGISSAKNPRTRADGQVRVETGGPSNQTGTA